MDITVEPGNYYARLDKFLRNNLEDVPLSEIYKFLRKGFVKVNGKTVGEPSYDLQIGDKVTICVDLSSYRRNAKEIRPIPLKLDILYEDENLLAIDKKPYIAIHPGEGTKGATLIHGLMFYGKKKGFKPYLVHRLDRETSGVLLVAKNPKTARTLSHMFRDRLIEKEYITLVHGVIRGKGVIDKKIDGVTAVTEYTVLRNFENSTLLKVVPHTGRTHQIRKHMAMIGHPVVGDKLYGVKQINELFKEKYKLRRQFLHCLRLVFTNPTVYGKLNIKSPLPEDLKRVIEGLQ